MAILTPVVEPGINSSGNSTVTNPKIIFERAIDMGSINESNFFIVSVNREGDSNSNTLVNTSNFLSDIVPSTFKYRRLNLNLDTEYTGYDFGNTSEAGKLFRSEITLVPRSPLNVNTNYAVIISKNVSLLTVFDASIIQQNPSSSGGLKTAGVYTGLVAEKYLVSITASGDGNTAQYNWTRISDSYISKTLQTKSRYAEIDKGVKIRFEPGFYTVGDIFEINVVPSVNLSEMFTWNFSTGTGDFQQPKDELSDRIINLPVLDPNSPLQDNDSENSFYVVSVEPELGASLVRIANKGFASLNSVFIQTLINTDEFNGWKFEVQAGALQGQEQVAYQEGKILVTIEPGKTTTHQVVDALMVNPDFIQHFSAFALPKATAMQIGKTRVSRGAKDNTITITFNKNIDETSVKGQFKITKSEVYPFTLEEDLYCDTLVEGKKLILTIEE
jgi:hypothetical protein